MPKARGGHRIESRASRASSLVFAVAARALPQLQPKSIHPIRTQLYLPCWVRRLRRRGVDSGLLHHACLVRAHPPAALPQPHGHIAADDTAARLVALQAGAGGRRAKAPVAVRTKAVGALTSRQATHIMREVGAHRGAAGLGMAAGGGWCGKGNADAQSKGPAGPDHSQTHTASLTRPPAPMPRAPWMDDYPSLQSRPEPAGPVSSCPPGYPGIARTVARCSPRTCGRSSSKPPTSSSALRLYKTGKEAGREQRGRGTWVLRRRRRRARCLTAVYRVDLKHSHHR